MISRRSALAFALGSFPVLGAGAGCGTPTFIAQSYDGPPRPRETIAILRFYGDSAVQLLSLDGEAADARVSSDARLHLEVLPGRHTLLVQNAAEPARAAENIAFIAEAGRVYRVDFVARPGAPAQARIYAIDSSSDRALRDVTIDARTPAPIQPAPAPAQPVPAPAQPAAPGPIPTSAERTSPAPTTPLPTSSAAPASAAPTSTAPATP